jgi:hypothetical protein
VGILTAFYFAGLVVLWQGHWHLQGFPSARFAVLSQSPCLPDAHPSDTFLDFFGLPIGPPFSDLNTITNKDDVN